MSLFTMLLSKMKNAVGEKLNSRILKPLFGFFVLFMFNSTTSFGQTTNDYRSAGATTVNLDASTNWERWNGTAWVTATAAPIGVVASGNTITILATATFGGSNTSVNVISGVTVVLQGLSLNPMNTGIITMNGTFVHNSTTSFSRVAGVTTFSATSTCEFRGSSSLVPPASLNNRTYGNLSFTSTSGTWNTGALTGTSICIVNGNLSVGAGVTVQYGVTGAPGHSIKGNVSIAATGVLQFNAASAATINFNGTVAQSISNLGTLSFNSAEALIFGNAAGVTFNQSTTLSGSTTVSSGSILAIGGGTLTLAGTPAINGTFQINASGFATGGTWTYGAGANLIYNTTGNFGENGGAYWPTGAGAPTNVSTIGTGGITMNTGRTVTGTFLVANGGVVNANNITANGTLQINAGGFVTGTPTYGTSSTLVYNTTSYTTSTNEFPNTGVKNVTITSPSTNTVTLDNDKTITGTFAIGANTLNGGKSINAGTITIGAGLLIAGTLTTSTAFTCSAAAFINLSGSWNVTGFTKSTSTVNFTGSGNLNTATNFYNVTNSAGTRSIAANFDVENALVLIGGNLTVTGGSGKSLTMSGAVSVISITTGSIFGTDAGPGNDLSLIISGAQTTFNGNATGVNDDEKKFFNVTVNNGSKLALSRGILCKYGTFTVNGTLQINPNGYVNTSGAYSGNAKSPAYNASTGSLIYNNGGLYSTAGEWPAVNGPANVTIDASGTNVSLTGNRTLTGALILNDGIITTSSNTLSLSNSNPGTITRSNGYVVGNLQRAIATGTNTYSYPVGTASGYTPASIAFTGTTGAGNVTVVSLNGASSNYPSSLSATKRVARYWTVTNSGVSGFTAAATFNYLGADLVGGATQSSVKPYKFDAPSTFSYPSFSTGTLSFTESGLTSFSEFGAGECGTVTVAAITGGGASICIGATQQLANTTPGGVWSSDASGMASVSSGGLVTGVAAGTTTIRYTVTDISGCTGEATQSVTVLPNHTITATAGANGSISPNGMTAVCDGANQTYTIVAADACHTIADVVVDGQSQGAVGTYTFTNVTANHTISATFVLNTYTITVSAGANGSITPATGSVNCGDNATYTITPNACYAIADVVVDGQSQGAVGTYTFTNVTANHTISATFVLNTYTITVSAGANGAITPATGSVNCGDNATYTITPNACYSIADVVVDGQSQGAVGTYTFTNVTANHTISATFVLNTYTITVSAGANGAITPATGSVNCGDNATYTITPNACYAIADVVVDGQSQGAVGTYTFTNVTANHTISASFVLNTYTITVSAGANGAITPATGSVNCGDNATYTITPNACYSIADVMVDGQSQGAVGTYTFTNVTANHTISATFVLNTYTITVSAGANGAITPATGSVNCGDNATYTITADACYSIADVVVDGQSQGAVGTYTFTNVTANHTISATFVLNTYTVTVTAGANGTITPGTGSVNCGANATYTITADAGFAIADVLVDGNSQGPVGTYTFTNVTANHTISATFVANASYTITASAGANGTIAPNGVTTVSGGANQTYTITPATCYHVNDVLVDGISVGAVTTYTFTNVTANHTIAASFAINATLTVSVSGIENVCPYVGTGTQITYTATSAGATGFTWVVPPTNVTIISGQGTANLTVTFQNGFTAQNNKQIRVTALSSCGNSPQFVYYLLAQSPSTPAPIVAGSTNICGIIGTAATISYTIPSVVGATSYVWTNPAGTTITHTNGTGINDTTVTLSFTNGFATSNLTVASANGCGTSSARSIQLARVNPSTPGLISGPTNACPYIAPGGTPATYSVVPVTGATSYTWTVPAGAIGLTGQGTNSISFTYPTTFTSGSITVTATNGCGTSAARTLAIGKLNPAAPGVIDVIQTGFCPNRVYTYTIAGLPSNATSVLWTVPSGATLVNGQGSNSITVSYPATSVTGFVTAQAVNNCGSSTTRKSEVRLAACPPDEPRSYSKGGTTVASEAMTVNVYPNPSVTDFKLQVVTAGKEKITVRILDMQGRAFKNITVSPNQTVSVGSDLKAGSYLMEVRQGEGVKTTKLIKF